MSELGILLWLIVLVLVALPPRWDPAIWLKEASIRWAERLERRRRG